MAKKRSKLKGQVKKIAKSIAKLYKDEVIKQNLIDTGLMRDSFRVDIALSKKGDMEIFVSSVFYFQYIDGSPYFFDVSGEVFKSKKYKVLEDRLLTLIAFEFALDFPDDFDTSDAVTYDFSFDNV